LAATKSIGGSPGFIAQLIGAEQKVRLLTR